MIEHILKTAQFIKHIIVVMTRPFASLHANYLLRRLCSTKRKSKEAVIVFICQEASIWYSLQSVYEAAERAEDVRPFLLLVPKVSLTGRVSDNGVYDSFKESGYHIIHAYDFHKGKWFDLKKLHPDYVFLPRPYDSYLPSCYRRIAISRYAKCCYAPYAYLLATDALLECTYNLDYFKYIYMIFTENDVTYDYLKKHIVTPANRGLHKIYNVGYTRLDLRDQYTNAQDVWKLPREKSDLRLIWTPRWTEDPKLGGTNFFKYKDVLLDYVLQNGTMELMFRPHPLAFSHFEEVGLMTHEEIESYRKRYEEAPNASYHKSREYFDLFYSSDVLVTDFSSVIMDYIMTGKPIIFCSGPGRYNEYFEKIIESFYIVHSWKEMKEALEMLRRGQDTKKVLRQQIIKELLENSEGGIGEEIIKLIKKDFQQG